ncbi:MAG: adenylosuccinate synthase [Armatimonadota bacterium]
MANKVVIGAQWGDEAKGKVVDYLAADADYVIRFNGGNNAGHTVVVGSETYKFHLVPCGILHPNTISVIGDGEVLDPEVLINEINDLDSRGIDVNNLKISMNSHIIMPYHKLFDGLEEKRKGGKAIGTTNRGIGPVYSDKASRIGIRVAEFIDPARFRIKLAENLAFKNEILTKVYGTDPLSESEIYDQYAAYAEQIKPFVANTNLMVSAASKSGKNLLFEAAQGTLLDIDHGTYPYVTSSHTVSGAACLGTGIGPKSIDEVIGVAKAYTTRVGAGIFPTELFDETGEYIREKGHEYGTTTGRARRCGWQDMVTLRYSMMINDLTGLAVTLLDVLSGLETLKVCKAYVCDGEMTTDLPGDWEAIGECSPVFDELPGWSEDITEIRDYNNLPVNAKNYLAYIEEQVGVPVKYISVGAERSYMIAK